MYQLVKKASKNVILHEKDKNIGIILGMIFFLFLPTTNIYIILGLVIISVFLQKQLFNLEKQKRDLIIEMIDKVIEEKLLEEQNKQSQSKEDVQSEQIQEISILDEIPLKRDSYSATRRYDDENKKDYTDSDLTTGLLLGSMLASQNHNHSNSRNDDDDDDNYHSSSSSSYHDDDADDY